MSKPQPSVAMVTDTCLSLCKAMKLISKQLVSLSGSYSKLPFQENGDVYQSLSDIMKDVRHIQYSLVNISKEMNIQFDNDLELFMPDEFIITQKEYKFLNNVLTEYTGIISNTSEPFSLFYSPELYTKTEKDGKEKDDN